PHRVNYRANLAALKALGARRVLALNTVGGITGRFGPRVLACPDQLIDYTWGRIATIGEEPVSEVLHVDFGDPYTPALRARVLACPDQLIDYTWGRIATICEEPGSEVMHVDFGDPYTPALRARVLAAAAEARVAVVDGGCYGATQGPRLETKAEIARMRRDG